MNICNIFRSKPKFETSTLAIADYFKRNGSLSQLECCQLFLNWNLHKVVYRLKLYHNMKFEKTQKTVKTRYGKTTKIVTYHLVR
jgi:hypothetical protein